jgi:hypothetical protein
VTRLIWAETSRLLSRRLTGIAMIVMLLGLAGYQLVVNDALSPPSGEERAAAERSYQQAHQDWAAGREQYEKECRDTGAPPDECVIPAPTLAEFTGDSTPLKEVTSAALKLSTLFVALVTFTIAASFIGAEYTSRFDHQLADVCSAAEPCLLVETADRCRVCCPAWHACRHAGAGLQPDVGPPAQV